MIFYTGNDGSGAFSFRRHTWEGTAHFAAGSGELNTELFRVDWAGKATAISFGLTGGFVLDANGAYGRFNNWVNNVKDIKFFTATEYNTLSTATTNLTATTPGVTNFTYDIVAGQPNSVTYYVLGMGDANGTGI
jgi:hypothetical protein